MSAPQLDEALEAGPGTSAGRAAAGRGRGNAGRPAMLDNDRGRRERSKNCKTRTVEVPSTENDGRVRHGESVRGKLRPDCLRSRRQGPQGRARTSDEGARQ